MKPYISQKRYVSIGVDSECGTVAKYAWEDAEVDPFTFKLQQENPESDLIFMYLPQAQYILISKEQLLDLAYFLENVAENIIVEEGGEYDDEDEV